MGAKLSAEMIRARELLRAGQSAAEAARQVGLSKGAISQDVECRKLIDASRGATFRAVAKLVGHGVTVKGACAEHDVTVSGYYKWKKRNEQSNES